MTSLKFVLACAVVFPLAAQAQWPPQSVFVEGGFASAGTHNATVGLVWPWQWKRMTAGGELSGVSEVWLSEWSARRAAGGREGFTQLGFQPLVRLRFDGGASPWFVEGGIGLTYMNKLFSTPTKTFSTRFNFIDSIGAGYSFGASRRQELGLRLSHISNARLKEPNPGENFVQLRYTVGF